MKVSIIIPVYNQLKMTIDCLRDVYKTYGVETEIIVVDDGSKEPVFNTLSKIFPDITVLKNDTNMGFAKTTNKGIRASTGDFICLLNNDVQLPNPGWLKIMVGELDKFDMVSPAGGKMSSDWQYIPGEAKSNKEKFSYLVGWCLAFKKEVIDSIGYIPENFGMGFFDDVLFCYRAKKAGFKMGIVENTGVIHKYHQTFKAEGYNLAEEYKNKREIFLDILENEKR
jgi:GT2 family glycosyltransferase